MKNITKIIIRFVLGLTAAGFIMAGIMASSASAVQVDTSTVAITVDQLLTQMQQDMINKNYAAMLLKDQMRTKMMAERTPLNFMQGSIQPVIMEKIRAQIKLQQMEVMTVR